MDAEVKARILAPTPENLRQAADAIRSGGLVAMPTETVYGLAGNAFAPEALARIFETKERPTFDPLIIHVGIGAKSLFALQRMKLLDLRGFSPQAHERADRLIQKFWPGPLTLVLPKDAAVPDLATSGLGTVALRMPRHPVAQMLIAACGAPLAAPSANRFGRISPTTAQHVMDELGDRIEFILDGGACEIGVESTVLAIGEDGVLSLLRPGGVSRDEIENCAGCEVTIQSSISPGALQGPGMLESHYAPTKPFHVLGRDTRFPVIEAEGPIGLLLFKSEIGLSLDEQTSVTSLSRLTGRRVLARILTSTGDLREAAQNLFAEMRFLDHSEAVAIFSEPCPSTEGLGHAITDRMKRAAAAKTSAPMG